MSSIDERIVQLELENREFETNARQSIRTLGNLDRALDLKSGSKGLDEVRAAAEKTNFAPLLNAANMVSDRLSTLGIVGVTALQHITNAAMTAGTQLAKSLTIDQVTAGWNKYVDKTASVQTLVNATGKSADEVGEYLNKLMWFSDETSYSFTEMASALGQMVSNGGKIDNLIPMLEGMANATSYAGKGAAEFQRVLYNLNQSYSQGYLSLMDWRSVQLANVGSEALQKTLIEAAKAVGTLNEEGKTAKGTLVEVGSIGSTLAEKWATSEVMEKAFGQFAEMTEKAYEMVQNGEVETASEAYEILSKEYDTVSIRAAKAAQEAKSFREAIDATKDAVSSGWMQIFEAIFGNYEVATKMWTALANGMWDFFASGLGDKAEWLNNILNKQAGVLGTYRDLLFEGIGNALLSVADRINIVRDAFSDIFPAPANADVMVAISHFRFLMKSMRASEEEIELFGNGVRGLFAGFRTLGRVAVNTLSSLSPLGALVKDFGGTMLIGFSNFGNTLTKIFEMTNGRGFQRFFANARGQFKGITKSIQDFNNQFAGNVTANVGNFIHLLDRVALSRGYASAFVALQENANKLMKAFANSSAVAKAKSFFDSLKSFAGTAKGKLLDIPANTYKLLSKGVSALFGDIPDLWSGFNMMKPMTGLIDRLASNFSKMRVVTRAFGASLQPLRDFFQDIRRGGLEAFSKLSDKAKELGVEGFGKMKTFFGEFNDRFQNFLDGGYVGVFSNFSEKLQSVTDWLRNAAGKAGEFAENIGKVVDKLQIFERLSNFIRNIPGAIGSFLSGIPDALGKIGNFAGSGIGEFLTGIADGFGKLKDHGVFDIVNGGLLTALLVSIVRFAFTIKNAISAISLDEGGIVGRILSNFGSIRDAINDFTKQIKAKNLLVIAAAIGVLAVSLVALSTVKTEKILPSLGALLSVGVILAGVVGALSGLSKFLSGIKGFKASTLTKLATAMIPIAAAMLLLSAAVKNLSSLSWGELARGLSGIAAGLILLTGAMTVLSIVTSKFKPAKLLSLGLSMIAISAAVLILGKAVERFGGMDWNEMVNGLILVGACLAGLTIAMAVLNRAHGSIGAGVGMIAIAASMLVMAEALRQFSGYSNDMTAALKTIGLMGLCLAGLVVAFAIMGTIKAGRVLATGVSLIAAAAAVVIMGAALKILASIDMDSMTVALLGLSFGLAALVLAAKLLNGSLVGAAAMVVISAAMVILSAGIKLLSSCDMEGVGVALVALAGCMLILGVATALLHSQALPMIAIAAAMVLMGAAATITAIGLTLLASVPFWDMMGAVLGMSIAMIAIAGALVLLGSTAGITAAGAGVLILLGLAMVIAAGATIGFAVALAVLSAIDIVTVAAGLGDMAAILLPLAAGLLSTGVGALVAGAGLAVLGAGCVVAAVGLLAISVGGAAAAAAAYALGKALDLVAGVLGHSNGYFEQYGGSLKDTIGLLKEQEQAAKDAKDAAEQMNKVDAGEGIDMSKVTGTLDGISGAAATAKQDVETAVAGIGESISGIDLSGDLQTTFMKSAQSADMSQPASALLGNLGTALGSSDMDTTQITSSLQSQLMSQLSPETFDYDSIASTWSGGFASSLEGQDFSGIGQAISGNLSAALSSEDIGEQFNAEGVTTMQSFLAGASSVDGTLTGEDLINTLITGFGNKTAEVETAGNSAGEAGIAGSKKVDFTPVGENYTAGLAAGILNGQFDVIAAIDQVCAAAVAEAQAKLQIHSPSRVMAWMGRMTDAGLVQGIMQDLPTVAVAAGRLAMAAIDGYDADSLRREQSVYSRFVPVVSMDGVNLGSRRIAANGSMAMAGALEGGSRSGSFTRELNRIHEQLETLAAIGKKTCDATEAGHVIALDDGTIAGRVDRVLGGYA